LINHLLFREDCLSERIEINCKVNEERWTIQAFPMERLLDVLREQLSLTGTKEGCGEGECGACSVLIDGQLVNSCLVPVAQVAGCEIKTIEGLALSCHQLHTVQQAFIECGGAQCGICTPGMVVAAHRFLKTGWPASNENVREAIAGNLCRCTGYARIVAAVQAAAGGDQP